MGGYTLLSRLLGFLRDVLFAAILGAGSAADAFFVALKFPNLFRRLFAEGAFNAAFVPTFTGLLAMVGEKAARRFAEEAQAVLLTALFVFVVLAEWLMPWMMLGIAPGFSRDPEKFALAVELTRITFPYLLFISLAALMGAVLNAHGRFAAAAFSPVLLNLVLIGAVLGWGLIAGTPAHALAWGLAAAGILQFLWLALALARAGFTLKPRWPRLTPEVRKLLRLMLPVAVGAGVYQINVLVDVVIGSLLPSGAIAYLYYADRVNQLPLGVVGIAMATALLPLLARQIRSGDDAGALASQNRAVEFAMALTLPAAFALVAASWPIVAVLFGRGAFDSAAQAATAWTLAAYALGLPAHVLVKILATAYFAREDTATPVKAAVLALGVNLVLNLALMGPLGHVGIALATSAAAWINALVLGRGLLRRGRFRPDPSLVRRIPRITLAALAMALGVGLFAHFGQALFLPGEEGGEALRMIALALLVGGGVVAYLGLARLAGVFSLGELRAAMRRPGPPEAAKDSSRHTP